MSIGYDFLVVRSYAENVARRRGTGNGRAQARLAARVVMGPRVG
ncbi:MAG: hypothetical protein ACRELX_18235 [Longimicrobiales bacterium]